MTPRTSVVIPVYNEGEAIIECLDRVFGTVEVPVEVLVVYDTLEDTTVSPLQEYAAREPRLKPTHNTYGRGPANAIRFGLDHANAKAIVVTMADGSDDPAQIDRLAELVEAGAVVAAASRYAKGGRQIGGPPLKRLMSRGAGLSLYYLAGVGIKDSTNSFKAYSSNFVRQVGVQSDAGFEIGIEMVVKARRLRLPVAEIPTIWNDRTEGQSNFKLAAWIPKYLRWYRLAFGKQLTIDELNSRTGRKT